MDEHFVVIGGIRLTRREFKVLDLASQGLTNKEIAREVSLSPRTIGHMLGNDDPFRSIYAKIGVQTKAAATAWFASRDAQAHDDQPADWVRLCSSPSAAEDDAVLNALRAEALTTFVLEAFDDDLGTIVRARNVGESHLSLQMGQRKAEQFRKLIKVAPSSPASQLLLSRLGLLLYQNALTCVVLVLPEDALRTLKPISDELMAVARACGEEQFASNAKFVLGTAYYFMEDYERAVGLLKQALLTKTDLDVRIRMLRLLALSLAYRLEKSEFSHVEGELRNLVSEGNWTDPISVCAMNEGLGRAHSLLGSPRAFHYLEPIRIT